VAAETVGIGGHQAGDFDCDGVRRVVEGGQDGLLGQRQEFRFGDDGFGDGVCRKGKRSGCKVKKELD